MLCSVTIFRGHFIFPNSSGGKIVQPIDCRQIINETNGKKTKTFTTNWTRHHLIKMNLSSFECISFK